MLIVGIRVEYIDDGNPDDDRIYETYIQDDGEHIRIEQLDDAVITELERVGRYAEPVETLDNEVLCPDDEADRQEMLKGETEE